MSGSTLLIDDRIKGLEREAAELLEHLLTFGADLARQGSWAELSAVMLAARHLEAARWRLDFRQGGRADSSQGPIDPPPVDPPAVAPPPTGGPRTTQTQTPSQTKEVP